MNQLGTTPSLTDRMLRAARLDVGLYNEVEADVNATPQALTVVAISALAGGIGTAIGAAMAGRQQAILGGLVGGILAELIGWAVWSYVMYFVGTRFFGGTATYGELLRTLGFAYSPGVLQILRFIPILGGIITLVVFIWRIATGFIAIREALDFDSGKTIATIVIGFIGYLIVVAILAAILAAIGLGTGLVTGS